MITLPTETDPLFWSHVKQTDDCWEWQGATRTDGYGFAKREGKYVAAHRYAFTLTQGPIPTGLQILHTCDNKLCVRPDHLRLGTQKDNMIDMALKKRQHVQVLSPSQVQDIRRRHASGKATCREIATEFGLTKRHVNKIVQGVAWKHLDTPT